MTQRPTRGPAPSGGVRDRGAVAVEFALLLPVLLILLFGIIDFGLALNAQVTLTQAAREGARLAALGQTASVARTRAQVAAPLLNIPTGNIAVTTCASNAGPTADGVVAITYAFTFVTPIGPIATMLGGQSLGTGLSLTARGVLPCET